MNTARKCQFSKFWQMCTSVKPNLLCRHNMFPLSRECVPALNLTLKWNCQQTLVLSFHPLYEPLKGRTENANALESLQRHRKSHCNIREKGTRPLVTGFPHPHNKCWLQWRCLAPWMASQDPTSHTVSGFQTYGCTISLYPKKPKGTKMPIVQICMPLNEQGWGDRFFKFFYTYFNTYFTS